MLILSATSQLFIRATRLGGIDVDEAFTRSGEMLWKIGSSIFRSLLGQSSSYVNTSLNCDCNMEALDLG